MQILNEISNENMPNFSLQIVYIVSKLYPFKWQSLNGM